MRIVYPVMVNKEQDMLKEVYQSLTKLKEMHFAKP